MRAVMPPCPRAFTSAPMAVSAVHTCVCPPAAAFISAVMPVREGGKRNREGGGRKGWGENERGREGGCVCVRMCAVTDWVRGMRGQQKPADFATKGCRLCNKSLQTFELSGWGVRDADVWPWGGRRNHKGFGRSNPNPWEE